MQRRDALKHTALAVGLGLSATTITGALSGCGPESLGWIPEFFTEDQARLISAISNTLLPATDTPGALDVGVPQYIDTMVGKYTEEEEQQAFVTALTKFDEDAKAANGKSFASLSAEEQNAYLKKVAEAGEGNFFRQIKGMVFRGYFTSETVGKEVLNFLQIPGEYKACIPLSEVPNGRAWTL